MSTEASRDPLVVDVVADLICPWCYIGRAHLQRAFRLLAGRHELRVRHRPFELNPEMPAAGMDRRTYRTRKFGSWARSQALDARIGDVAAAAGLALDFERMTWTPSTFAAHRLLWLHRDQPHAEALLEGLYRAYFVDGRDIGRLDELVALASAAGLDGERVGALLRSDAATAETRADVDFWYRAGITGVPAFVVGNRLVAAGAEAPEVLAERLEALAAASSGTNGARA